MYLGLKFLSHPTTGLSLAYSIQQDGMTEIYDTTNSDCLWARTDNGKLQIITDIQISSMRCFRIFRCGYFCDYLCGKPLNTMRLLALFFIVSLRCDCYLHFEQWGIFSDECLFEKLWQILHCERKYRGICFSWEKMCFINFCLNFMISMIFWNIATY